MEKHSTDTQSQRPSQLVVKYWLDIDRTDMELSGAPAKYHSGRDVADALGIDDQVIDEIFYRIRKRLTIRRDSMNDNSYGK